MMKKLLAGFLLCAGARLCAGFCPKPGWPRAHPDHHGIRGWRHYPRPDTPADAGPSPVSPPLHGPMFPRARSALRSLSTILIPRSTKLHRSAALVDLQHSRLQHFAAGRRAQCGTAPRWVDPGKNTRGIPGFRGRVLLPRAHITITRSSSSLSIPSSRLGLMPRVTTSSQQ